MTQLWQGVETAPRVLVLGYIQWLQQRQPQKRLCGVCAPLPSRGFNTCTSGCGRIRSLNPSEPSLQWTCGNCSPSNLVTSPLLIQEIWGQNTCCALPRTEDSFILKAHRRIRSQPSHERIKPKGYRETERQTDDRRTEIVATQVVRCRMEIQQQPDRVTSTHLSRTVDSRHSGSINSFSPKDDEDPRWMLPADKFRRTTAQFCVSVQEMASGDAKRWELILI